MDKSLLIQYTIVAAILAGACIWILVKVIRLSKNKGTGCNGCSLHEQCGQRLRRDAVRDCDKKKS